MIVETFKVKPTGFLASWRYININVSPDGLIYTTNVPGEPAINLDRVSDYRSNNRYAYTNGQLITTFCNLTTYTRFNVYAQDERPFAYVTTVLDDTTCGFETPLPEPAVPPNPFGEPSYGEYRFFEYCDVDGLPISVLISKKGYVGSAHLIETGDKTPVRLSYKPIELKSDPIRPLECTLSFINTDTFLLSEFYTEDERTFMVEVEKDGLLIFKGYIIPDSCSEPFAPNRYPISIKCTDALGSLKTVTYPLPIGSTFDLRQSFIDILAYCLAPLNLNLDIVTICNLYEVTMPNSLNDDPLSLASINPLRLADDTGKTLTCYEALRKVCEAWGMFIVQQNGKWNFVRFNEPSKLVVRQRTYNYKGLFLTGENLSNERKVTNSSGADDYIAIQGANNEIQGAYKRVEVLSNFGKVPSILYNGDFEAWDGFNFKFWTKYGGIDISRIQRSVVNTQGKVIPIQNYSLQFNKRANPGKWLQHSDIPVQIGDKIKYTYRVGQTQTGTIARPSRYVYFKMRIKVGEFYLYNVDAGNTYTWVKSLSIVTNAIENPYGDLNSFTFGFEIPECPVTGLMTIQLFGFTDKLSVGVEENNTLISAIQIDDITATKTSQSGQNDVLGILNITDNLRYFTNKPDRLEILFGDYFFRQIAGYSASTTPIDTTRPPRDTGALPLQESLEYLYAIYVNNKYSTGWVEYGVSGQPVAFGMALAKSILRAYQMPFVLWQGELKLAKDALPFNYLDVIGFVTPNEPTFSGKRFSFMGVDIDIKTNILSNVKLSEVFDAPMVSVDNTVPYYPNAPEPIFIQDANYVKITGIFTDEFTQEFN